MQNTKCIILAAGISSRLRPLTNEKPKCLLEIGGKTLLQRTIENVVSFGIRDIAVVVGYKAELIRNFVKENFPALHIKTILNPNYANTNNAYSLLLAKNFLKISNETSNTGLLLLDSDILFSSNLLSFLLSVEVPDKIAVRVDGQHNEEEMRVKIDGDKNIIRIGKDIPVAETYGESIGIEVFSSVATRKLFEVLENRIRNGNGRNEFYESSFQQMIDDGTKIKAVDVSNYPSIEIDTLDDLKIAESMKLD